MSKTLPQVWVHTHTAMNADSNTYERPSEQLWMPTQPAVKDHSHGYGSTLVHISFESVLHFQIELYFTASIPGYQCIPAALSLAASTFAFHHLTIFRASSKHAIRFHRFNALRYMAFRALGFLLFFDFFRSSSVFPSLCQHLASCSSSVKA